MSRRNWLWATLNNEEDVEIWTGASKPTRDLQYPIELDADDVERLLEGDRSVLDEKDGTWDQGAGMSLLMCIDGFGGVFPKVLAALEKTPVLKVQFRISPRPFNGAITIWEWYNIHGSHYLSDQEPSRLDGASYGTGQTTSVDEDFLEALGLDGLATNQIRPLYLQLAVAPKTKGGK